MRRLACYDTRVNLSLSWWAVSILSIKPAEEKATQGSTDELSDLEEASVISTEENNVNMK